MVSARIRSSSIPVEEIAVAVNYRSGSVAAFGIEKDGRITEAFYIDQHEGQPQPPSKQPGPRAHGVVFSSDSRFAYVADIGLDRVYSYRLDAAKRTMAPLDPPYVAQPAGSGPRRLQLHPNGKFLYLARETDSQVSVFAVDNGRLKEIQSLLDAAGRLHRQQHDGGNPHRPGRQVPVRLESRARQYRRVCHRPRRQADGRRTRGRRAGARRATSRIDPTGKYRVFVEPGHGKHRRPAHRPRHRPPDADRVQVPLANPGSVGVRQKVVRNPPSPICQSSGRIRCIPRRLKCPF